MRFTTSSRRMRGEMFTRVIPFTTAIAAVTTAAA